MAYPLIPYLIAHFQSDVSIPNAVANIAWRGDLVVAFGHSFVEKSMSRYCGIYLPYIKPTAESAAATSPGIEIHDAILAAEGLLNGTYTGHPTKTHYLATSNSHLALVHAIQIENENLGTFYEAFVDAHSGQLLSLTDFVCYASASRSCNQFTCSRTEFRQQYTVLPTPGGAAPPDGFQVLTNPEDNIASPSIIDWPGWHSVSTTSTTTTA
jgi:extracellular elastinolytic metalloproteinase